MMGYLLAVVAILVLLVILIAVMPQLLGGANAGHTPDGAEELPRPEKQQMDEPQEEFISDTQSPGSGEREDRDPPNDG